jgi:Ala-tRNA(Pro) deacylase
MALGCGQPSPFKKLEGCSRFCLNAIPVFRARLSKRAQEVVMPLSSLKEYLDKNGVKYVVISHSPAVTAQGIAALAHIPGKELAKTIVVKVDGELALAVLPASLHVNLAMLKDDIGAKKVQLASEDEFKNKFPECETGAMPPFGNLYGMKVFADENLARDKEIAFNACSHRELIRLAWEDFARLARPKMVKFAGSRSAEAA